MGAFDRPNSPCFNLKQIYGRKTKDRISINEYAAILLIKVVGAVGFSAIGGPASGGEPSDSQSPMMMLTTKSGRSGGIFCHRRTRLRRGTLGFTIPHDDADNGKWSERRDLNPRPFAPQANALPVCATPRKKAVRNQMGILLNWPERYHVAGGAVNGICNALDRYDGIICLQLIPNKIFSLVFRCTCSSIG